MLYPGTQRADPDVVRTEAQQNVDRMNANQKELKLLLGGAPDTRLMSLARDNPFDDPDTSRLVLIYIVVITILLLVPAINLSGITLSRMRRRMEENRCATCFRCHSWRTSPAGARRESGCYIDGRCIGTDLVVHSRAVYA